MKGLPKCLSAFLVVVLLLSGCSGQGQVTVPDVFQHPRAAAESELQAAGFNLANALSEYSDTVPYGSVIRSNPPSGAKANRGDTVTLTISIGSSPTPTPTITSTVAPSRTPTLTLVPDRLSSIYGEAGGNEFCDVAPAEAKVVGLEIRAGNWIDAIQVMLDKGKPDKHGGDGGVPYPIKFAEGEFIKDVSGTFDTYITQLIITTNKQTYGPFGLGGGKPFGTFTAPGSEIIGFCGRSGDFLNAIGVIFRQRR